ncbi:MFS transporter [Catellatospora methionotrophica]|uniref:MFS transporter n=2 Tax=Catellatospora methionotrophica TaxID=121620 RepID=A0A8J3LJ14_9ACTN|nr:MFS transporter [Catellatospora methionotrophica]GIG13545.1 MFS transporter [Catellatospora methionotrophica]
MTIEPYRKILGLPGVRALMLVGLIARVPVIAAGIVLTLHVVNTMHLGYAQAGLVGTASTLGTAIGSPLAGRLIDRHGLRPVLIVTTAAQGMFWSIAPQLSYHVLLIGALIAGVLSLPVFSLVRQCIAALIPADQRRPGFALDSMAVELSYMLAPAAAVAAVTAFGSRPTMYAVGIGVVGAGLALITLNPPTRSAAERENPQAAVPRRQWLRPRLFALLSITAVLTFVLTATDLTLIATLKGSGQETWIGLVIAVWCGYSLIGGFVYGALHRSISPLLLAGAMSALTIPLGLVGGGWWWLLLALIPAGVLCAPSLSATIDTMSQWVPSAARGEAMGLHGTALTVGVAAGAPFAGTIIDAYGPGWAFAATGTAGVLLALIALPLWRLAGAGIRTAPTPEPVPAATAPGDTQLAGATAAATTWAAAPEPASAWEGTVLAEASISGAASTTPAAASKIGVSGQDLRPDHRS